MTEESMVTNLNIRCGIDANLEIMGERGCRIIYRGAGAERFVDNLPPYDFEPCTTERERNNIIDEVVNILGLKGAIGLWRRMGYLGMKAAKELGGVLESFERLEPDEKFLKALEVWSVATNEGKIIGRKDGKVDFDVPECQTCKNYKSERSICSSTAGGLQYISDWAYGKNEFLVKETKCKAKGDETCYYALTTKD